MYLRQSFELQAACGLRFQSKNRLYDRIRMPCGKFSIFLFAEFDPIGYL